MPGGRQASLNWYMYRNKINLEIDKHFHGQGGTVPGKEARGDRGNRWFLTTRQTWVWCQSIKQRTYRTNPPAPWEGLHRVISYCRSKPWQERHTLGEVNPDGVSLRGSSAYALTLNSTARVRAPDAILFHCLHRLLSSSAVLFGSGSVIVTNIERRF